MASDEAANFVLERGRAAYAELQQAKSEIERLRSIVRVNGLRWGHSHAEIDELLNQQQARNAEPGISTYVQELNAKAVNKGQSD